MENRIECVICLNDEFDIYDERECSMVFEPTKCVYHFDCSICGKYNIGEISQIELSANVSEFNRAKRAAISHKFKLNSQEGKVNTINLEQKNENLVEFLKKFTLPSPWHQSIAILRFLCEEYNISGTPLQILPIDIHSIIGSPDRSAVMNLIEQLSNKNLLKCEETENSGRKEYKDVSLTIDGWNLIEEESKGKIAMNYGFIALKFGDDELDSLVENTLKLVGNDVGYEIIDLRKVEQAGIIDNIMRNTIRNAAFVIVDLTHDNSGAYWEAGYAEGLGKTVIYICKKDKFDEKSSHFDTNHCTTIFWNDSSKWKDLIDENFHKNLVATLNRSLDL